MAKQTLSDNAAVETDTSSMEVIRRAKDAAELANARKSELLADVCHELCTPLQVILTSSRLGRYEFDRCGHEKAISYLNRIEKCANVLLELVKELLDATKLDFGVREISPRVCDLSKLLQGVIEEFGGMAEEKGMTIRFSPPNTRVGVLIDHDKVEHVVRNLLSNAIKASSPGHTVDVLMSLSHNLVSLRIVDEGPGILSEESARLFERFARSSRGLNGEPGTGLGLAICRKTITQHGGRIWIENGSFRGAIACFELPRNITEETLEYQPYSDDRTSHQE